MTEQEKMNLGLWYDANYNQELIDLRMKAMDLCFELNQLKPSLIKQRNELLTQLLGYQPIDLVLISPFICDYGTNIHFGKDVFVNSNCYFMDGAHITIDDHVKIGPFCGFYTAAHPLEVDKRDAGLEKALPIHIGKSVWLGANVSIMPGVSIGENSVIGAGSVVTHDIEANVVAAGVPCQVIKKLK